MFRRELFETEDGSFTFRIPDWEEQYHSKHGALLEALHVFIKEGFLYCTANRESVTLLEMGFGTGLNVSLTQLQAEKDKILVDFTTIDAYPIDPELIKKLNYPQQLNIPDEVFLKLHTLSWNETHQVSEHFKLTKLQKFFNEVEANGHYDLIYYDAFGMRVQPELWTEEIFEKLFKALKPRGILVTYACNGPARRALQAVGFEVQKLQGPPGKKEMMRAVSVK